MKNIKHLYSLFVRLEMIFILMSYLTIGIPSETLSQYSILMFVGIYIYSIIYTLYSLIFYVYIITYN